MNTIKRHLNYANVMASFAVFLALGGAAFAANQARKNSVSSASIRNESIVGKDVKNEALTGADLDESTLALPATRPAGPAGGDLIGDYPNPQLREDVVTGDETADDTLTGADVAAETLRGGDIQESTLAPVPTARTAVQAGLGRYGFDGACNPDSSAFVTCVVRPVPLSSPARLLIVGTVNGELEGTATSGVGDCRIVTPQGPVAASLMRLTMFAGQAAQQRTLIAVTDVLPAGTHSVRIDCSEVNTVHFPQARLTAVALSAE